MSNWADENTDIVAEIRHHFDVIRENDAVLNDALLDRLAKGLAALLEQLRGNKIDGPVNPRYRKGNTYGVSGVPGIDQPPHGNGEGSVKTSQATEDYIRHEKQKAWDEGYLAAAYDARRAIGTDIKRNPYTPEAVSRDE